MGSADDRTFNGGEEIVKLKESLKLLDIGEIIGKAKMHAAEAYSHAKEAYRLRDDFFKLIEQHAYDDLDSGTKERLSLAAASLNAALGVADAAVATANVSARAADSAQCKPCVASRAYESSVLKDEKATNLDSGEIEALARATKDLISEDAALIKAVADDAVTVANVAASDADSDQGKPTLSTKKLVARDKKVLSREEEEIKLEQQGCEKMAHLEAVREGLALEEVADAANIAASATDPDQDNPAASTKLDYGERLARRAVVREGLARGKIDFLREEERTRLEEEEGKAEEDAASVDAANVAASASDSDQGIPSLLAAQTASFFSSLTQTVSTSLDAGEKRPRREAVREGLARGKQDFSREEERIRLEAQVKAKNECKKKKREEESRMRDDKRKQKMDKNTRPKDKGKGKK